MILRHLGSVGIFCYVMVSAAFAFAQPVSPESGSPRSVSLSEVVQLALERNPDILAARYEAYRGRTAPAQAQAVFDTTVRAGFSVADDRLDTASSVLGTKTTRRQYSLGLDKTLNVGTRLAVEAMDNRDTTDSAFTALPVAHDAVVRLSLEQPFARGAFGVQDRGNLQLAELSADTTDLTAQLRIEQVVLSVQQAYWRLALAQEQTEITRRMVEKAQELFRIFSEQQKLGLIETPEVLAAQANVDLRLIDVAAARQQREQANRELLRLLNDRMLQVELLPEPVSAVGPPSVSTAGSLERAFARRREVQQARNNVTRSAVQVSLAENALLPAVTAAVSLTRNGLEAQQTDAWRQLGSQDNRQWTAGVQVNVPWENRQARAQRESARWEQEQAAVRLQQVEQDIRAEVYTAASAVDSRWEQVELARRVARTQADKLAAEQQRFVSGRSSSDVLIRYQQDALQAELSLAAQYYAYHQELISLQQAEGSLLIDYGGPRL